MGIDWDNEAFSCAQLNSTDKLVLLALLDGLRTKEIAQKLGLNRVTVSKAKAKLVQVGIPLNGSLYATECSHETTNGSLYATKQEEDATKLNSGSHETTNGSLYATKTPQSSNAHANITSFSNEKDICTTTTPPTPQQRGVVEDDGVIKQVGNTTFHDDSRIKPYTCQEAHLLAATDEFSNGIEEATRRLVAIARANPNYRITFALAETEHLLTRLHRWPDSQMPLAEAERAVGHWLRKGKVPRYPQQLWDDSRQGVPYWQLHRDLAAAETASAATSARHDDDNDNPMWKSKTFRKYYGKEENA